MTLGAAEAVRFMPQPVGVEDKIMKPYYLEADDFLFVCLQIGNEAFVH